MRNIDKIIIHCTATPAGRVVTVKEIDQWHRKRGFEGIGYHYVVYLDGSIVSGRAEEKVGAHCAGFNASSIGVCYVGGCDKNMQPYDTRNQAQKDAMARLIKELKRRYPSASIKGHCDYAAKACPSFNVDKWKKEVGL